VRDSWFKAEREGVFRGQCAELCGKDHGFMPIVVHVLSEANYAKWVGERKQKMAAGTGDADKPWTADELKSRGAQVFAQNCVACHQSDGMGIPGTFPALNGSKVVTGPADASVATVLHGVARDGKPTAMQAFKQLSDVEIAAVVTYARNAWDNKAGDAISPADVKAARSKQSAAANGAEGAAVISVAAVSASAAGALASSAASQSAVVAR
jgi:cytochrome c oxidase subunit II